MSILRTSRLSPRLRINWFSLNFFPISTHECEWGEPRRAYEWKNHNNKNQHMMEKRLLIDVQIFSLTQSKSHSGCDNRRSRVMAKWSLHLRPLFSWWKEKEFSTTFLLSSIFFHQRRKSLIFLTFFGGCCAEKERKENVRGVKVKKKQQFDDYCFCVQKSFAVSSEEIYCLVIASR